MDIRRLTAICLGVVFFLAFGIQPVYSELLTKQRDSQEPEISSELFKHLLWRNIGPANMMGRVSDVEGVPGKPNIVYVGSASGGIWKTTNNGLTWTSIFDKQSVASIGDIALEPGNPDVIYAGTGESNVRNSVSFGNGVYKSTDGGKTWIYLGLKDTRHISRIVINPKNPKTVYVGALGHAYGSNPARGVYMSTDGGKNWQRVLYIDDRHGVADMDINPQNPNIVYAAMWRFERKPWTFTSGDTEGGLFKSVDSGSTWIKLSNGLPKLVGRMGVKVAPSNPDIVYVMTEAKNGTLYKSYDEGESFQVVSKNVEIVSRGFYYTDLRIDPKDENRVYALSSGLYLSIDGGEKFKRISSSTHGDYHSLWIDPLNPKRIWQGQDGGICVSYDRGKTWDYVNSFPICQFYQIYADNREPFYYVGGGLQDNGTWYGPSTSREPYGIMNEDWRMISFGDGFHIIVHPDDHELFISESQAGGIVRTNMRTREQQDISPQPRRADGAPVSTLKYRFNWNTPIILSPHDKNTVYIGANVVFKSTNFGDTWEIISKDLTTNDPEKQKVAGGPPWPENTTAEYYCTIISLAESPAQPGVLWAGTDDGHLHVSMDGGEVWKSVVNSIPDIPSDSPVSHVEPSHTSAGMAYISFDRHMLDDFRPYVFRTADFGRTWINITGDLPENAYVWVLREDPKNSRIIYAGTELGIFVSFSRGDKWVKLNWSNMPVVAVHDIIIHPRDNDLILGTHGRGIWILDSISFLQEISPDLLRQEAYIFTIKPAMRYVLKPTRYGIGDRVFRGKNQEYGALITYYLKQEPGKNSKVKLEIMNESREVIRTIDDISSKAGLNRTSWDLRYEGPWSSKKDEEEENYFFGGSQGPQVLPGIYTIRISIGERSFEKPLRVRLDPTVETAPEDIAMQLEYTYKLRDWQSTLNRGVSVLDTIEAQLKERKKTLENSAVEFPEEVRVAIESNSKKMSGIRDTLIRPEGKPCWSQGPRLLGRIRSLFRNIDGVNAGPTRAQVIYFNELKEEFETAVASINNFLSGSVKELNDLFSHNRTPVLLIPKLIKNDGSLKKLQERQGNQEY